LRKAFTTLQDKVPIMLRGFTVSLMLLFTFALPAVRADEKPALEPGNYVLYYGSYTSPEEALCLLEVKKRGGDLKASILAKPDEYPVEITKFKVDGRKVDIAFDLAGRELTFEGIVAADNPKLALGSFGDEKLISRGRLVATAKDTLGKADMTIKPTPPDAFEKMIELFKAADELETQLQQAKDPAARDRLARQVKAAEKEMQEKAPALFKTLAEKNGDSPFIVVAALSLLQQAANIGKPDQAAAWVKAAEAHAEPYGRRLTRKVLTQCAEALQDQKGFSGLTAQVIDKATKLLPENAPLLVQARLARTLLTSFETDGKSDLAAAARANLEKLELGLDKEYLAKVPPFKPKRFGGRANKANRVVMMELFTGAECPPCVAADVAFDALLKAYAPTDLVLTQYHMHIPAPDPLANPVDEKRFEYYEAKFPKSLRGTPTVLFNGKPDSGGGGGMTQSESKFKDFTEIINPLLEESTPITIEGDVGAKGDVLTIKVDVKGIKEPSEYIRLRLLLVEDSVRYAGGNGVRFHHHLVRAMPGGDDGFALKEKTVSQQVKVDIAELRKELAKYLEEYAKKQDQFPTSARPLDLKRLLVVAFVQDDKSREILQAAQFEVPTGK
jgi:hypothetical protein